MGGKSHSWVTDCSALVYPILDELGNVYRSEKNVPLNLCGQGLMVTSDVIRELGGWPYRSLTEDYELKLDGYLRGFSMMYYPHAVIYTEEVMKHRDSYARRLRWIKGYSQCDRKYRGRISEKIKKEKSARDVKFDLLYYKNPIIVYMCAVVFSVMCGIGGAIYYSIVSLPYVSVSLGLLVALPLSLTYLIVFVYCAMAMFSGRHGLIGFTFARVVKTLFLAPIFIMEFIPMYLRCMAASDKEIAWQETPRVDYSREVTAIGKTR